MATTRPSNPSEMTQENIDAAKKIVARIKGLVQDLDEHIPEEASESYDGARYDIEVAAVNLVSGLQVIETRFDDGDFDEDDDDDEPDED